MVWLRILAGIIMYFAMVNRIEAQQRPASGPDPANPNPNPAFWNANGVQWIGPFWVMTTENVVQPYASLGYIAGPAVGQGAVQMQVTHVSDDAQRTYMHWHSSPDNYRNQADTNMANAYWDARFGCTNGSGIQGEDYLDRAKDAYMCRECFTYAFYYCCQGTWDYPLHSQEYQRCLGNVTTPMNINVSQPNDILAYNNGTAGLGAHATIIQAVKGSGPYPSLLRWKFQGSGIYTDNKNSDGVNEYDTPMMFQKNGDPYNPPKWTWLTAGAGDSTQLFNNKVYRPNKPTP